MLPPSLSLPPDYWILGALLALKKSYWKISEKFCEMTKIKKSKVVITNINYQDPTIPYNEYQSFWREEILSNEEIFVPNLVICEVFLSNPSDNIFS